MRKCPKGNQLLPRMHFKSGRYYHIKRNRWKSLSTNYHEALRQYAEMESPRSDWSDLVTMTYADFTGLADNTLSQYQGVRARIVHGFSDFAPHEVTSTHVTQFLELYRTTPNIANRMLSVLRQVFDKGVRTGACDFNPAHGVKRFPEAKRDRLLTDQEYAAIHAQANAVVKAVMDVCYLTGQRVGDVLAIRRDQITADGIEFRQQKTGQRLVVAMTHDLDSVIRAAKRLRSVPCAYLFHPRGKATPYSYRAIRDAYERARRAAGVQDTTLHDIRAKSLTDLKRAGGDATALAGHRMESTTLRYLRGKEIPVVSGPVLRKT